MYTFAYVSLISLESPSQFFSDLTEETCRYKFRISGKDVTVPELLNLLVPLKKTRLQYNPSLTRKSPETKFEPQQFEANQVSLALLPTSSWIILICSIQTKCKLGINLGKGNMFCFRFYDFLVIPQPLHMLFQPPLPISHASSHLWAFSNAP